MTSAAETCISACSSCLPEHVITAQAAAQVRKWEARDLQLSVSSWLESELVW